MVKKQVRAKSAPKAKVPKLSKKSSKSTTKRVSSAASPAKKIATSPKKVVPYGKGYKKEITLYKTGSDMFALNEKHAKQ